MAAESGARGRMTPPRAWVALVVLVLPTLVVAMDASVLYLATPAISADLRPTGSELLWVADIYSFVLGAALLPMGALADRIGRQRLLLAGAAGFGVASAIAARTCRRLRKQ